VAWSRFPAWYEQLFSGDLTMANAPTTGRQGGRGRLLKAKPLVAEPLEGGADRSRSVPPAPIPVEPDPPAPIPVEAAPEAAAPGVAAPIPVEPTPPPPQPSPSPSQPHRLHAPQPVHPGGQPGRPVPSAGSPEQPQGAAAAAGPAAAPAQPAPSQPVPAGAASPSAAQQPARPVPVGAAPIVLSEEQKRHRAAAVAERKRVPGRKAVGVREELEELAEEGWLALRWRDLMENHRSWVVSAIVHMILLIALALYTFGLPTRSIYLMASSEPALDEITELEPLIIEGPVVAPRGGDIIDRIEPEPLQPLIDMKNAAEGIDAASVELVAMSIDKVPYNDLLSELGQGTGVADQRGTGKGRQGLGYGLSGDGMGLGGRGGRRGDALGDGATKQSEEAVDLALKWLAEHQMPDGSWSFNHQLAPTCQGQCPNPGTLENDRLGATAMGVLPFLGAGHTHQVGKYKRTVAGALNYLIANMKIDARGGALNHMGGRMYAHGLATIALCEAYGMQVNPADIRRLEALHYDGSGHSPGEASRRERIEEIPVPNLGRAAQLALNFVMYAQEPTAGGWRYEPRQVGDTSVVGWQLMALMSGRMARLNVNPNSFVGASRFLDGAQVGDYGADYKYLAAGEQKSAATQAIGLLCRMYLGWRQDHPGLIEGVRQMGQRGPNLSGGMYYNYYATQVMHHFGGDEWEQWNPRMRDFLVGAQSKAGHTAGSWYWAGSEHGRTPGARLYYTSLSAMTLQVYYRHMPLYRKDVLDGKPERPEPKQPEPDRPHDEF
jgi:hypothetical protein